MTRRLITIAAPVLLLVGIGLPASADTVAPPDGVVGSVDGVVIPTGGVVAAVDEVISEGGGVIPPVTGCYTVTLIEGPFVTVCPP